MTLLDSTPRVHPPHAPQSLALTTSERAEVRSLAEQLSRTAPALVDDTAWLAAARTLSCRLPARLLEAIRVYRFDPGTIGALLIEGLPIDEGDLPATPSVRDSVRREADVPAVVPLLLGLALGEVVAYREEKTGALVQDVVPVPGMEASQSNAGSRPLALARADRSGAGRVLRRLTVVGRLRERLLPAVVPRAASPPGHLPLRGGRDRSGMAGPARG
jgi:hypothetical protein